MNFIKVFAFMLLAHVASGFITLSPRDRVTVPVARASSIRAGLTDPTFKMSALPASASVSAAVAAIQSSATIVAASGVAEPGSVDAPGWVLPVGAGAVILLAGAIPLLLKVGKPRWCNLECS